MTVSDAVEVSAIVITNLGDSSVAENVAYTSATPALTGTPIGTVTYTLGGTDSSLFTVNASTGVVSMIARNYESAADAGADNVYNYTLTATDADGNTDGQEVVVTVSDVYESPAGQSVIDLGSYGNLIAPVQVEGAWYYYWDRSGNGTSTNTGLLNGGVDYTDRDGLDAIFREDINGSYGPNLNGAQQSTNTYRYATLSGVRCALPTMSDDQGLTSGYQAATAYSDPGPSNGTTTRYGGLIAIWDAFNGATVGTTVNNNGFRTTTEYANIPLWAVSATDKYASAHHYDDRGSSQHWSMELANGNAGHGYEGWADPARYYVALEVI